MQPTRYERALLELARADPALVVMTAENRAAIRTLAEELGPRFIDVGIAEQTMVGMAAGMALRGRRPVVHALAAFLTMRAFEFIRTDIGIAGLPVTLVGHVPGFLSEANGPTHQAVEDVAIMRGIPGMRVFCPADEEELAAALPALLAAPGPLYIRQNQSARAAAVVRPHPGDPARVEEIAPGGDVALLAHGILVAQAMDARERLAAAGVSARVLNLRMPWPLDSGPVLAAARETRLLVTIEDHLLTGGLFTIVSELLVANGVRARVLPLALEQRWFAPALIEDVLRHERMSGQAIAERVLARLPTAGAAGRGANRVVHNAADPTIARSQELWQRARGLIPAGTQTLAKGPGQHVDGVAPKYLERARGARVWDVDGNEYLDMTMGVGPLSLGYAEPAVDEAIRDQLERGITFSLMHPLEVEVAELVRDAVPGAESVRFSKTGCDVTSAAVRLARAFTGRDRVACCGYHGWHDWYISVTDRAAGIPAATRDLVCTFAYNDVDSLLDAVDEETACVILEPVVFEAPKPGFLEALRRICDERGALLVFDEMWTGFRLALGGAQERFGVRADLACFSKAIANGMPLSALTGRAEVMELLERDVFFFTTFGGEALSLAAAAATIRELAARRVPERLAATGKRLKDGYNALARRLFVPDGVPLVRRDLAFTSCIGMDCRTIVTFAAQAGDPLLMKSFVQQELVRRGVLWSGFHNLSAAHREADVDYLLGAYADVLPQLAGHLAAGTLAGALRGKPIEPVFRKTSQFNTKPRRVA